VTLVASRQAVFRQQRLDAIVKGLARLDLTRDFAGRLVVIAARGQAGCHRGNAREKQRGEPELQSA
jgi:hypothetical protein